MANIKSAKKRILVNQTKYERNKGVKSAVKTSIKKVEALGGKIMIKAEAPGVGPFAAINDPTGAALTIMEAENIQAWEE